MHNQSIDQSINQSHAHTKNLATYVFRANINSRFEQKNHSVGPEIQLHRIEVFPDAN